MQRRYEIVNWLHSINELSEGLLCDPHTGTGVPPASVAEWTLQGAGNKDFYDGLSLSLQSLLMLIGIILLQFLSSMDLICLWALQIMSRAP